MIQPALFHETYSDALGADIQAVGGFKKVGMMLWPTLDSASASAKLRASLNPEQPHKLDPTEVLQIKAWARDAGSSATVQYESQHLGYQVEWLTPKDDLAERLDAFERVAGELQHAIAGVRRAKGRVL